MAFDLRKLRGRIVEVCGTQEEFARLMGKDRSTLNMKLTGKREFTQSEINKACQVLSIPDEDVTSYFFTPMF